MYLALYWAREEGLAKYQELVTMNSGFRRIELSECVESYLTEHGRVMIFE
jgi:hypothetical protein